MSNLGWSGVTAQWMTVPIWGVGTLFLLVVPQLSDRFRDRRWHISACLTLAFVSAVICATVEKSAVQYTFICFLIAGVYTTLPLSLSWASETFALPAEKRAVAIALVNCVGSLSTFYGSYLWPDKDAPAYRRGFTAVACFSGCCALLAAFMPIIFKYLPKFVTEAEMEIINSQTPGIDAERTVRE